MSSVEEQLRLPWSSCLCTSSLRDVIHVKLEPRRSQLFILQAIKTRDKAGDEASLGPVQTCNSGHNVAVLNAQIHRWGQGHIETSYSGANHAVLHANNDRWGLGPTQTCKSGTKVAVLHAKTTDEGWNLYWLVLLVLSTLFCIHKSTGEVWDPQRLVILL